MHKIHFLPIRSSRRIIYQTNIMKSTNLQLPKDTVTQKKKNNNTGNITGLYKYINILFREKKVSKLPIRFSM